MNQNAIVDLYTELANNPEKDFAWDKGLENAIKHNYKNEWIKQIPAEIWDYCAAVGNPFCTGVINAGDSVLDIGCGAGIDLCVAALLVGEQGRVFGVDVTPAMVEKATDHAELAGFNNITVLEGCIEKLPIEDNSIDAVISNGAINLALSKDNVFREIHRVLKSHGHFVFADMIKDKDKPDNRSETDCNTSSDSWAECIAGTLQSDEIIKMLLNAGFKDVQLLGTNHYKTSASTVGACFSAQK